MPKSGKLRPAIEEELLKPLGRVAANFAMLEETISFAIWLLLVGNNAKEQRTGQIITTRMSFREKVVIFEALYKHRFPQEAPFKDFNKVKNRLKRSSDRRNTLLHSEWGYLGNSTASMRIANRIKSGVIDFEFEKISEEEIEKIATSITETAYELQQFCIKF